MKKKEQRTFTGMIIGCISLGLKLMHVSTDSKTNQTGDNYEKI
jgi:hypothetical protein